MARVAVVITKKEFEQVRKDRRTRLVDVVALLVGLLMLTGGVGAVWAIEPVIPPQTEWSVQWNQVDGGGKACAAPPKPGKINCELGQIKGEDTEHINEFETHTHTVKVPDTAVNITKIEVKVAWTDETVERNWTGAGKDAKPTGPEHPDSWDCMTLKVTGPAGESFTGSHCGGETQGENGAVGGHIDTVFEFAPMPNLTTVQGKRAEAEEQVVLPPTKGGIGVWTFEITLDRAGDVRGNHTKQACEADPGAGLCPTLVTQLDSNEETGSGRTNQGNCRLALYYGCDGSKTDTMQEYYLHVIWTTYSLRQMV